MALRRFDNSRAPDLVRRIAGALGIAYLPLRGTRLSGKPTTTINVEQAHQAVFDLRGIWVYQADRSIVIDCARGRIGFHGLSQAMARELVMLLDGR